MLIREIEGGTDSNNRKITVITIYCKIPHREGGATPVRVARVYYNIYRYTYLYI